MEIEMVDTIRGPLPRVALEVEERVVEETEWQQTVQIDWRLRTTGEIIRQDGRVQIKRWPEDMNILAGLLAAGG